MLGMKPKNIMRTRSGRPGSNSFCEYRSSTSKLLNADNFHSYRSRVNQALRTAFGPAGELLAIQPWGRRPNTRYGLRIEKRQVQLQEK